MDHRDLNLLRDAGVRCDLLVVPDTELVFVAMARLPDGSEKLIRTARGSIRSFKTLDGVHKYAKSVDANRVIVYNSLMDMEAD